ncbi:surface antigen 2 (CA-2), partial [Trypanosoma theileri]
MAFQPSRLDAVCEDVHADFTSSDLESIQCLCQQVRLLRVSAQRLVMEHIPSLAADITSLQESHLTFTLGGAPNNQLEEGINCPAGLVLGAQSLFSHCKKLTSDVTRGVHRLCDNKRVPKNLYAIGYTPHYYRKRCPHYTSSQMSPTVTVEEHQYTSANNKTNTRDSPQPQATQSANKTVTAENENPLDQGRQQKMYSDKPSPFGQATAGAGTEVKPSPFGQATAG